MQNLRKEAKVGMNESEILSELKSALEWVSDDDNPIGSITIKISSVREMIKILEKRNQSRHIIRAWSILLTVR